MKSNKQAIDNRPLEEWFKGSRIQDGEGNPIIVYHGTREAFNDFSRSLTVDGGFHFGSLTQAQVRNRAVAIPVYLKITHPRRSKDTGGNWRQKIISAKKAGHDGIIYLNRYEGITLETILRAESKGVDLDKLTDDEFRKFVPEAQDSYIAFYSVQIKVAGPVVYPDQSDPRPGTIKPKP